MIMRILCIILAKRPPNGEGFANAAYYFVYRLARKYFAFRRRRNELFPFSQAEIKCVFPHIIKRDVLAWIYEYWQWLDIVKDMEPEHKSVITLENNVETIPNQTLTNEAQHLLKIREE